MKAVMLMLALASPAAADYAEVNGLKLYYEIHGTRGAKPPLVLLHGGGSSIETSFARVLPGLAKNRQVIAFDQQGHGRTADIPERPFTFEQSADDAAALLRHLAIDRADFLGYSNGGSIAMQIAVRHPKLVRRLVVASAMVKRDGLVAGFFDGMRQASLENMPAEFRENYTRLSPHPERLQSFHDKSVQRMLGFKDWPAGMLKGIQSPVLLLFGDRDVVRAEHAVEMLRLIPHAQLMVLPDTDHMQVVERWPVAAIERFLDEK
ncbi:MAG TPA: alpha/beta hydrolase [Thermoanaerobaculia bacterium]